MTAAEANPDAVAENGSLTKAQMLAALLVMLGPDSAAVVLRQFQPREIDNISREMSRFSLISREQQQQILQEFSAIAVSASTSIYAGVDVTRSTLEKALAANAGYTAVKLIPAIKNGYVIAQITLIKGTKFKTVIEPLA